ncbi:hypothetical protein [Limosilactobacillus oris]|uniref:hypothetical protein n=1 Tax=Limosilactobacillus oris TaxID=1632 RepID=UPI0024B393CD|nr:hypothetical protein [Limosilactobacillus oris]WHO86605.1 hypothetical protein QLX69_10125 [Limosilactobacillus oris]
MQTKQDATTQQSQLLQEISSQRSAITDSITKLKDLLSDYQTLAAKVGSDQATKQYGQQVKALQNIVDSYMKRSSSQEQHFKATTADIQQLGQWYNSNQQAIKVLIQRINALCSDIENHTVTIETTKLAPEMLKEAFEDLTKMSVAQYVDHINYKNYTDVLKLSVQTASQASTSAKLYASVSKQFLTTFQKGIFWLMIWGAALLLSNLLVMGTLMLPGIWKGLSIVVLAISITVFIFTWKHTSDLIDQVIQNKEDIDNGI